MVTKIKPQRIEANNSPAVGQVPKYVNETTFERDDASGGGSSSMVLDKFADYQTGENISIGDHLCYGYYTENFLTFNNNVKLYSADQAGTTTINYGEAFDWPVDAPLRTANIKVLVGGNGSWALTAKIYALTGTYGVDAVNTGAAILTSAGASGSMGGTATVDISFAFALAADLPAGQYAIKIEGSITGGTGGNNLAILGSSTGGYSGNAIDGATADATKDMYFSITSYNTVAVKGDASDINKTKYIGKATTNALLGADVTAQTRGSLTETGATEDEIWYLSDTPGTISTTPGTNIVIVGKGVGTDTVSLRGLSDMSGIEEETPAFNSSSNGQSIWTRYLSGGGAIYVESSLNLGSGTNAIQLDISEDGLTRHTLAYRSIRSGTSYEDNQPFGNFIIPANMYVRLYNTATVGGSTDIDYLLVIPF